MSGNEQDRIMGASPAQLRQMAVQGIPRGAEAEASDHDRETEAGPGAGDGGTSSAAPPSMNLETEMDPRRVRAMAKAIKEGRR